MKSMVSVCVIAVFTLAVWLHPSTAVKTWGAEENLEDAKLEFERKIPEVEAGYTKKIEALPAQYRKALLAVEKRLRKKGDLDGLLAVQKEKKRFANEQTVTLNDLTDDCELLRQNQIRYQTLLLRYDTQKNRGILAAAQAYVKKLEAIEKGLTRREKLDQAIEVQRVKDGVMQDDRVTSAEFELADAAVRKKELDELAVPAAGGPEKSRVDVKKRAAPVSAKSTGWKVVGGPGVTVYQPGETPDKPARAGLKKRAGITHTDLGRKCRDISAEILVGTEALQSSETDRDYSSSYSRSVTRHSRSRTFLRVSFHARQVDTVIEKPTLLVDYYTKAVSGGAIAKGATDRIPIYNIVGRENVTIDTKGIVTGKTEHRYSSYYSRSGYRRGKKFYGVIVTLFDGDGHVVYQVASPAQLKDRAPTRLGKAAEPQPKPHSAPG